EALTEADVAVVEADDAKPAPDEQGDQVLVPAEQLHAQAHDEQERLALRRAVVFHLEADAVGSELHRWGGGSISPPSPSRREAQCERTSGARRRRRSGATGRSAAPG